MKLLLKMFESYYITLIITIKPVIGLLKCTDHEANIVMETLQTNKTLQQNSQVLR